MHDPEIVAFEIRRPWPHRTASRPNRGRWHYQRWSPFVTLAGREFYFPSLITIWHHEPGGHDSNTVCRFNPVKVLGRGRRGWRMYWWQLHVHHWRIQWCFLQTLQRRFLSRCAWCGGGHTKRDPLCIGTGGWDSARAPLWRGETNIVHDDCSSVLHAHRLCLCDNPVLSNRDYGQCAVCGKFRAWRKLPTIPERYLASLPVGGRIPADKREWLKEEWAKVRAEREAEQDA